MTNSFEWLYSEIENIQTLKFLGKVTEVRGNRIESIGPMVEVNTPVRIKLKGLSALAQVIGYENGKCILLPFDENLKIYPGAQVEADSQSDSVGVGFKALGRVLNCFNSPIDNLGPLLSEAYIDLYRPAPNPLERKPIKDIFETKVKVIDLLLTTGKGQRMGIFSGAGVGKSTLLGMIARNSSADVNVICLVGERGREIREFIDRDLKDGLSKSVVIVSTAEESSIRKIRAAMLALAYAEYFRDSGKDVLFLFDSVTRLAQSLRELGVTLRELPVSRGYPPSCFHFLAKYLERFGNSSSQGSLTSFLTVLVEGDDIDEPVSDAVRAILDGHIILSRELANQEIYPAVDILKSISRLAQELQSKNFKNFATCIRSLLGAYEQNKDLVLVGAYKPGVDPVLDLAIKLKDEITQFFQQKPDEAYSMTEALEMGIKILASKR